MARWRGLPEEITKGHLTVPDIKAGAKKTGVMVPGILRAAAKQSSNRGRP